MKIVFRYMTIPMLTFVLFLCIIDKTQALTSGFQTEPYPNNQWNHAIAFTNLTLLTEAPPKGSIKCFQANNQGMIAIAQNGRYGSEICIYSSDGIFQYGYRFRCEGNFCMEWDGENLNICFVRSSLIISVDPSGNILGLVQIPNTRENDQYMNSLLSSTQQTISTTTYRVQNDFGPLGLFASSYSQLLVIDSSGNEKLIYDVNSEKTAGIFVFAGLSLSLFGIVVLVLWNKKRNR